METSRLGAVEKLPAGRRSICLKWVIAVRSSSSAARRNGAFICHSASVFPCTTAKYFLVISRFSNRSCTRRRLALESKQEHAGGGAIKAVDGVCFLSELISQNLHRNLIVRFRWIRLMDKYPGWFIDSHQPVILLENLECFHAEIFFSRKRSHRTQRVPNLGRFLSKHWKQILNYRIDPFLTHFFCSILFFKASKNVLSRFALCFCLLI